MIFLAIGLGAGILSGLFGIGGGVMIVPALVLLVQMPIDRATATSLMSLLLPVGALGVWTYYQKGAIDVNAGLLIALGLFIGAFFGAQLALRIPVRELQRAFAILLALVAIQVWRSAPATP